MRRRQMVERVHVGRLPEVDRVEPPARFPCGTVQVPISEVLLAASEHMLEEDVAQIVHDLKNPLQLIALESVLLDDKIARSDRLGSRRSLQRIQANVSYLDRLVLDLLDVCSLSAGHLALQRDVTDLRDLIERCVERMVPVQDRERVFIDAAHSIQLVIDATRIERVIANLLDNALKYTPISSGIVVRLAGFGGGACVSVIDAGPGIDSSELATVFDRYRRGTSSHGRAGTGLGLYVSKKIIEAHGGQIGVESIRGAGARFFFELPAS